MEVFRVGEVLLRSSQPLLPFLAPSVYRSGSRIGTVSRYCRPQATSHASRPFTIAASRCQQNAAARRDDNEEPTQSTSSAADDFSALLDDALDLDKKAPTAPTGRTSRFASRNAQQSNRTPSFGNNTPPTSSSQRMNTSFDDLLSDFAKKDLPQPRARTSTRNNNNTSTDFDNTIAGLLSPEDFRNSNALSQPPPPPPPPEESPIKLDSTVGRTIRVEQERGIDVGRAFRMLEMRCAQNSVRRDSQRQRFHERPGLKRKRLKSERWRRRFKETFKATVGMVQKMKAQGW
ncbi:hypothetical protein LTR37_019150 [Vermiconidia calcicola]|uniref:Uncharacterized protein n=1 Tax=Vermiconidia calcicola TaxID=1690605 RepID=A0ACC3MES9_9PEZI|nr:hypothetical protein LTR37_019150 [Vermiconidia calcicola]